MSTTTPPATKVFDYAALIDELRRLGEQANEWDTQDRNADSVPFKVWRRRLLQLVEQAKRHDMHFTCNVQMRRFEPVYPDRTMNNKAFSDAMTDTLVEMAEAIKWFDTYGPPTEHKAKAAEVVPKVADKPVKPEPPEWPKGEKLNYAWFRDHVPASIWIGSVAALGVSFTLGATFGNSAFFKSLTEPASQITYQPVPPGKAASK